MKQPTNQRTCVLTFHYKQELSAGGTIHGKEDVERVKKDENGNTNINIFFLNVEAVIMECYGRNS